MCGVNSVSKVKDSTSVQENNTGMNATLVSRTKTSTDLTSSQHTNNSNPVKDITDKKLEEEESDIKSSEINQEKLTPEFFKAISIPELPSTPQKDSDGKKELIEQSKKEILDVSKLNNDTTNTVYGNSSSSIHLESFAKSIFCDENIKFLKELKSEIEKPEMTFDSLKANIFDKFIDSNSQTQINLPSQIQNKLEIAVKNKDFVGLMSSLKDANNDIYKLVQDDTVPRFNKKINELNTSISNSINTQPIQQRLGEIDKQIQSLNGKVDLSSIIKLEKLNNIKQELKSNFLPSIDINDPKGLSEALTKFKEITTTKSSILSKPSLIRGDINTVYKSFDNLVKASQKNPPDGMEKLQALFNLEKEVKNFIQKNPDSGKVAVLKAFAENLAPLTEIKHTTHDQAKINNPNGDFELPKTPQEKVKAHINHSTNGNLVITDDIQNTSAKPGVRASLTKDITIKNKEGKDVIFKKGEKCVFIEKDSKFFLQKIEKKKDAEKGDLDEFEVKHELLPIDDPKLVKTSQSFTKTNDKLFPKEISVRDIKQGAIGDCYLIAGIYSITAKDPNAIYNMIKDNEDGTVTVKMFDVNNNTLKLEPKFITFEKSTLNSNEKAEDTLWVQMLEKAYAIHKGSYESIGKGGHSNEVFEAFTGISSTKKDIKLSDLINLKSDISPRYSVPQENKQKIKEIIEKNLGQELNEEQLKCLDKMTNGSCKKPEEVKNLLHKGIGLPESKLVEKNEILKLATNDEYLPFLNFVSTSTLYEEMKTIKSPTFEDAKKVIDELKNKFKGIEEFQGYSVSSFINKLETYAKENFINGDAYNKSEETIFNEIKKSLDSDKFVAIGTKKNIGKSQGKGHSGGESMVDGLAGQHAYSVLDTVEMNGKKFVKIGNPWGNEFSRDYVMKDGKLVSREFNKRDYSYLPSSDKKKGAGIEVNESWIELKDLTLTFENIYSQN